MNLIKLIKETRAYIDYYTGMKFGNFIEIIETNIPRNLCQWDAMQIIFLRGISQGNRGNLAVPISSTS